MGNQKRDRKRKWKRNRKRETAEERKTCVRARSGWLDSAIYYLGVEAIILYNTVHEQTLNYSKNVDFSLFHFLLGGNITVLRTFAAPFPSSVHFTYSDRNPRWPWLISLSHRIAGATAAPAGTPRRSRRTTALGPSSSADWKFPAEKIPNLAGCSWWRSAAVGDCHLNIRCEPGRAVHDNYQWRFFNQSRILPAQRRPSSPETKCWNAWTRHQVPRRPAKYCCGFWGWGRRDDGLNFVATRRPKRWSRSDWASHLDGCCPGDSARHRPGRNGKCWTCGGARNGATPDPARRQTTNQNPRTKSEFERDRATPPVSSALQFSVCFFFNLKKMKTGKAGSVNRQSGESRTTPKTSCAYRRKFW